MMAQWKQVLVVGFGVLIIAGCRNREAKTHDDEFRAAMTAGNVLEAYTVLGQIEARGLAAESSITPMEKAECYLAYAEKLVAEDFERALQTAELARRALQQIEQSGEPVPPSLDQKFTSLYNILVAAAPEKMPRPEAPKVSFGEDFPESVAVDRTRPLDTQILELLMTEGLARLEERNRQLETLNQELRGRVEELTGPITDIDQRLDQVSSRVEKLDEAGGTVGRLEGAVAQIAADTQTLKEELGRAIQALDALKADHGGTADDVQVIQTRLAEMVARAEEIGERVEQVDARIAKFEQGVMVGNLFRDGVSAYNRGDLQVARENLATYLERAPGADPNVASASALLGVMFMDRVEDILTRAGRTVSRKDAEEAQKALAQARQLLVAARERLDDIAAERLRESVKRELTRVDDYERQLARL